MLVDDLREKVLLNSFFKDYVDKPEEFFESKDAVDGFMTAVMNSDILPSDLRMFSTYTREHLKTKGVIFYDYHFLHTRKRDLYKEMVLFRDNAEDIDIKNPPKRFAKPEKFIGKNVVEWVLWDFIAKNVFVDARELFDFADDIGYSHKWLESYIKGDYQKFGYVMMVSDNKISMYVWSDGKWNIMTSELISTLTNINV